MNTGLFFKTLFRRELISQKTYSLQVILSVMIGVGAVAGIQSYKSSLTDLIQREAKNLMGADLAFQTPEKIRPFQENLMESTLPEGSEKAEVVQFLSMLQGESSGEISLSLVRAMDVGYPFYGKLVTEPEDAYSNLRETGILLEENLAKNLELKLGDPVRLGDKTFSYQGALLREPGSLGGFVGMAPTSVIRKKALEGSGLEERGSRIRYTVYAKLGGDFDPLEFKNKFFDKYIENDFTIFHNTESNSGSQLFISNTLDFLSLLGLGSFFLGSIAIFISTRTRVSHSQKQISILKCLGLQSFYVRILVLSETLILSIIGAVSGLFLGHWIQSGLPSLLPGVDSQISQGLNSVAFIEGVGLGIILPILVSIHSLWKAGKISPLNALKNPDGVALDKSNLNNKFGLVEWVVLSVVFALFFVIAYLDTGSLLKSIILCGVFFLIPLLVWGLYVLIRSVLVLSSRFLEFPRVISLVFKKFVRQYGFISLSVIGLGSAIFVLLLSLILRESLLNLGGARQITKRPNVFILDIRGDQQEKFKNIVSQKDVKEFRIAPVFRARLDKINGEKIDRTAMNKNANERDWRSSARTRDYMLSYRNELFDTESVTKGEFWNTDAEDEISIEKDFAKYLGADIGDELEFKLEGFPLDNLKGKVTNLRSVNWSDMKPNFVVLFSGGSLEKIPGFYISSFYLESSKNRFLLQKELVKNFPNLTYIDTEKAVKSFEGIVEKVSAIINVMSSLLVFASVMLLVSVLYSGSRDRLRELVFYRVVGARKRFIRSLVVQEGLFLAGFSFLSGLALAFLADFILNYFLLDLESIYPIGNITIVCILVFAGVVASYYLTSSQLFRYTVKRLIKL